MSKHRHLTKSDLDTVQQCTAAAGKLRGVLLQGGAQAHHVLAGFLVAALVLAESSLAAAAEIEELAKGQSLNELEAAMSQAAYTQDKLAVVVPWIEKEIRNLVKASLGREVYYTLNRTVGQSESACIVCGAHDLVDLPVYETSEGKAAITGYVLHCANCRKAQVTEPFLRGLVEDEADYPS